MGIKAVITGDIINSGKVKDKEVMMQTLRAIFKQMADNSEAECHFEIYRGDSFQGLIADPLEAWRMALLIRAGLKGSNNNEKRERTVINKNKDETENYYPIQNLWDARISIGIGEAGHIAERITESHGEAFELSGFGLNKLETLKESLIVNSPWADLNYRFGLVCLLIDDIIKSWSKNSAEIIYSNLLEESTQDQLAKRLDISQSAVNQRLNAAQWMGIRTSIDNFQFELKKYLGNDH